MVGQGLANMIGNAITGGVPSGVSFNNKYSCDFDGVDQYALINVSLTSTTGSYSLWVKPDLTNDRWVIASDANTYRTFVGIRTLSNGKVRAQVNLSSNEKWKLETDNAVLNASNWTHIVLTHNGTEAKLYIDGNAVAQTFISSADKTAWWNDFSATITRMGAWLISGYGNLYWDGLADEVGLWTTEISAGDVTAIYNGGKPQSLDSYSPLGWWRNGDNNGGLGTTVTDEGSGGNNATLVNGTSFSTDAP
tara:strand:- start:799 stop:1545 length:747 start_codon:yes stop_codon:yes gene_type:complete